MYSVGEVHDTIAAALKDNHSVDLCMSSKAGHVQEVHAHRSVLFDPGHPKYGRVEVSASVDQCRVKLAVDPGPHGVCASHGCRDAVEAAAVFLDFVNSDQGGRLMRVHAKHGRLPKVHELKTLSCFYRAMQEGKKQFEYRRDDRGFEIGDVLELREWIPATQLEVGRYAHTDRLRRVVTYILRDRDLPHSGLSSLYAILSLAELP